MATKIELEEQNVVLENKNKELEAMISLWLINLEMVERSPDHPMDKVMEVIGSMRKYLG
mgnify:CR=1 FL=1